MKVLVINSGSSSIKFALYVMPQGKLLASGLVEQIGEPIGNAKIKTTEQTKSEQLKITDHKQGLELISKWLQSAELNLMANQSEVKAVGHRVVHGGETFAKTTEITAEVKNKIKELFTLAPLHNPPNLEGITEAEKVFTEAKQFAVFDTAFFNTLPEHAYRYALPEYLYTNHGVRVYGFHGTSHLYVSKASGKFLGKPINEANLITIHLGNGASMAAIQNGKCIDTTLGMTPVTGLIMGTRSGDIDPGVLIYLGKGVGLSADEINALINKESGMKGLTGDNDMRSVENMAAKGNKKAQLALVMYAYRIKKYIGAYMAAIGPLDAIVFTAGVGENSVVVRQLVCENMQHMGLQIDTKLNATHSVEIRAISNPGSPIKILVTPTNEELEIAQQTYQSAEHID